MYAISIVVSNKIVLSIEVIFHNNIQKASQITSLRIILFEPGHF